MVSPGGVEIRVRGTESRLQYATESMWRRVPAAPNVECRRRKGGEVKTGEG